MTNDNDNKKVLNLDEIERQINFLKYYRGLKRTERLKKTTINLYNTLKSFGYKNVERKFLLSFINTENNNKYSIYNEIVKTLINMGLFKEIKKKKIGYRLRNVCLNSYMNYKGCSISLTPLSLIKTKYKYEVVGFILK